MILNIIQFYNLLSEKSLAILMVFIFFRIYSYQNKVISDGLGKSMAANHDQL